MVNSSGKVKQRMADINADIESTISGMKTSKAFDNMDVDYERFEKSNETYKNSKTIITGLWEDSTLLSNSAYVCSRWR